MGNLVFNVANTLLIVLVVLLLGISLNLISLAGLSALMAIAFIVPIGLAVVHFLAGNQESLANHSTPATATIARNLRLALFIAIFNSSTNAFPCIITYAVLGAVFALPYNVWVKKQMKIMAQT